MTSRPTTRATCADRRADARGRGPLAARGATLRAPRACGGNGAETALLLVLVPVPSDNRHACTRYGRSRTSTRPLDAKCKIGEEWRLPLFYNYMKLYILCAQRTYAVRFCVAYGTVGFFFLCNLIRIYIVNYVHTVTAIRCHGLTHSPSTRTQHTGPFIYNPHTAPFGFHLVSDSIYCSAG